MRPIQSNVSDSSCKISNVCVKKQTESTQNLDFQNLMFNKVKLYLAQWKMAN